jgi:hypothetical protein
MFFLTLTIEKNKNRIKKRKPKFMMALLNRTLILRLFDFLMFIDYAE